jgi:LPXTG-site transpeptidase (sortase) family protein
MEVKSGGGKKRLLLIGLGIVLAIALLSLTYFKVIKKQNPQINNKVVKNKDESDPIASGYKWSGGPEDPKKIIIPKISVDNFIQQVGMNNKKEVAAPTNIYLAGWYNKSVRPGQKGLSIIDGHLDGYTKPGIFNKLGSLSTGDEYEVELGSGDKKKFRVLKVETVDTDKAVGVLFSQNLRVKSQLNLITCTGDYDKKQQAYNKRIVVSSELIN